MTYVYTNSHSFAFSIVHIPVVSLWRTRCMLYQAVCVKCLPLLIAYEPEFVLVLLMTSIDVTNYVINM